MSEQLVEFYHPIVPKQLDNGAQVLDHAREIYRKRQETWPKTWPGLQPKTQTTIASPIAVLEEDKLADYLNKTTEHTAPERDQTKRISLFEIRAAGCRVFGITVTNILANRRTRETVVPRQVCMCMMKNLTLASMPMIGKFFGGMDHTTVLHSARKYQPMFDEIKLNMQDSSTMEEWMEAFKVIILRQHREQQFQRKHQKCC